MTQDLLSLQEFLEVLADAYPDEKVRGKEFEPFLRDALVASPSHQFTDVWLWDDWPGRDGPDRGIDLVAEDFDGGLWGIQSKLLGPDESLNWGKLSTWVAATRDDPWVQRLLVSNVSRLSRNAEKELLDDPKTRLLLGEDLFDLRVDWPDSLAGSAVRSDLLDPRPHQVEAIEAICDGFNSGAARLQVHMACGTGKTFTALWAYQYLAPDLTVVLVPSLSLMLQTIREWTANTTVGFRYLPVCSDARVTEDKRPGEDPDLTVGDLSVLDAPATTDVDTIAGFLRLDEPRVVFCTYQSSDVLADACAVAGARFGLVVADEAHRTTGRASGTFATVLDEDRFPADRRLFMTGTPRTFTAAKDGDETVQSMDDTDAYGEVAYQLGFGDAVDRGLLVDYEVVVVDIEDPALRKMVLDGGSVELAGLERRIDWSTLVSLEGALRAIEEFDMSRLLSFHSRIKGAADWASAISVFQKWRGHGWDVEADTVNGTMNASDRKRRLAWLKQPSDNPRLLTNARCLAEGVDVPSLDGIVFADPRRSQVDIVQTVGRVMRTDPDRTDKVGRIVIPVVVPDPDDVDGDNVFRDSVFKPVWDVLRALKAHDFRLEAELNRLRGLTALGRRSSEEFFDATHIRSLGIYDIDKFELAVIEKTTSKFWWWLNGPFAQFVEREGHSKVVQSHVESFKGADYKLGIWVMRQRDAFKTGKMPLDQIPLLEAVPGWEWDLSIGDFPRGLGALTQFVEREGHARVPQSHVESFEGADHNLGSWVKARRETFKTGKMPSDQIPLLEAVPGWEWSVGSLGDFPRGLGALTQFVEREGHARVPKSHVESFEGADHNLGSWVKARREAFKTGKMPLDQIPLLEAVPGWEWPVPVTTDKVHQKDKVHQNFETMLPILARFADREGHTQVVFRHVESFEGAEYPLGRWVRATRASFDELPEEQVAALEAFPGWVWDVQAKREEAFERGLAALAQFVEREGHARVLGSHIESFQGADYNLGLWVMGRRMRFKEGSLSTKQIATLEAFPGWKWAKQRGSAAVAFERGLGALAQFVEREGHARVPGGHIESFQGADHNLGSWVSAKRQNYKVGKLFEEQVAALEAFPGWEWDARARGAARERAFERGLGALAQFVEREGHAGVIQRHVESFDGADYNLGVWVMARKVQFREGSLSTDEIAALEMFPGWDWGRKRGSSAAAFERGLGALAQFAEREGHARVPQSHVELFEGTKYPLGVWASQRRQFFKRGKMPSDQKDRLEAFPGWDWARKRGNPG